MSIWIYMVLYRWGGKRKGSKTYLGILFVSVKFKRGIGRRLSLFIPPMSPRKPRTPLGDLGTLGTAQSPWDERVPYAFSAHARSVRSTSHYMVFSSYNGLNGFAEVFYGKGCEHFFCSGLIGLCASNVPAEDKEACRRPWHPRYHPKPMGRNSPIRFFRRRAIRWVSVKFYGVSSYYGINSFSAVILRKRIRTNILLGPH